MYKLIKAKSVHAKQILPYLTTTCYWKEFAYGNNLNQSYEEFMLQWIITPRLPITTVLVKEGDEDTVCGCIITATTEQFGTMPDYTPHLDPKVMETFANWFSFAVSDSVVVELFYVIEELRGQGYGTQLYNVAEELAKTTGKNCISGFIWSFFPNSLINAIRKGRMVKDCIHFPGLIDLPLLYVEKKPAYAKLKDYFHTKEYLTVPSMLEMQAQAA